MRDKKINNNNKTGNWPKQKEKKQLLINGGTKKRKLFITSISIVYDRDYKSHKFL